MTKAEFIRELRAQAPSIKSNPEAEALLDAFAKALKTGLQKDGVVQFVGLGKIEVRAVAARKGHNPQNGNIIDIPAKHKVVFVQSKKFDFDA